MIAVFEDVESIRTRQTVRTSCPVVEEGGQQNPDRRSFLVFLFQESARQNGLEINEDILDNRTALQIHLEHQINKLYSESEKRITLGSGVGICIRTRTYGSR